MTANISFFDGHACTKLSIACQRNGYSLDSVTKLRSFFGRFLRLHSAVLGRLSLELVVDAALQIFLAGKSASSEEESMPGYAL